MHQGAPGAPAGAAITLYRVPSRQTGCPQGDPSDPPVGGSVPTAGATLSCALPDLGHHCVDIATASVTTDAPTEQRPTDSAQARRYTPMLLG